MSQHTEEIHLVRRPDGKPCGDDFRLVSAVLDEPASGQLLVRNQWMSVDPADRPRMDDRASYVPPFALHMPLDGPAIGVVEASADPRFAVGDVVRHRVGWRRHSLVPAGAALLVDVSSTPTSAHLGLLGTPGLTAYAGMTRLAQVKPGDTVFVSAAAGAVGSAAGQIARLLGAARIVGSAGGDEKVRHVVQDLGFDAAFDYKTRPAAEALPELCPDGIDVYFDNVGGEQLIAAIDNLRLHARIVICGMISQYDTLSASAGVPNLVQLIITRASMHGLLALDHLDLRAEFLDVVGDWLADGRIVYRETVVEGLANAPTALIDLLGGANTGKMLVHIGD